MTSIEIPNSVTSIGNATFCDCTCLTSIEIPNSVIDLGTQAFIGCKNIKSLTIPNSVTNIGERAFQGCSGLTSVSIPNSVTSMGSLVFEDCTSLPVINDIRYAGTYLVEAVESLSNYKIKSGTRWIGSNAFSRRPVSSMTIPNSVVYIEDGAFAECRSLTSIEIPNSVISIGSSAFNNCRYITSLEIPSSVTNIDGAAFYNCRGLTSVICKAVEPPILGSLVFEYAHVAVLLYVPDESVSAYRKADQWKEFLAVLPISSQEAIKNVETGEDAHNSNKILHNGQVLILRGDKTYTLTGQEVK